MTVVDLVAELQEEEQTLEERLNAKLEPLWQEEGKLQLERDALQARVRHLDVELKKIAKMRAVLNPEQRQRRPGGTPNGKGVSPEAVEKVRAWVAEHASEREFRITEMTSEVALSNTTVKAALNLLREMGEVRLVGRQKKEPGQSGPPPLLFRLIENGQPEKAIVLTSTGGLQRNAGGSQVGAESWQQGQAWLERQTGQFTANDMVEGLAMSRSMIETMLRYCVQESLIRSSSTKQAGRRVRVYEVNHA